MGPEDFPAFFNMQTQNSKGNAILSGSSVQHLLSTLARMEQRYNMCIAEAGHQNSRPVTLHWHSHDFNSLEAQSSYNTDLCVTMRTYTAHTNTTLWKNLLFSVKLLFLQAVSCLQQLSQIVPSCGAALQLTVYTSGRRPKKRDNATETKSTTLFSKPEKTDACTGNTHLQSHWDILLADIVVVLVSVQHNNCIGQGKAGITISKRRPI